MKRSKLAFSVFFLLLVLVLFPLMSACAKPAPAPAQTLKIGQITSITGPMAAAFKPSYDAVKPTQDLLNQRGGITVNGQKYNIEIIAEDDQSSPEGAVAAASKLMQAGIKFMMAPLFMPSNLAVAPICEQAKIMRIKPLGMGPEEVNAETRYSFFTSSSLYNITPVYDYLIKNYPKVKRIAIITPDDPGFKTAKDLVEKEIKNRGLELVSAEIFPIPTEDFYPILTKVLEQKPDAIDLVEAITPWSAGIINQSRELGFTGPIYSPAPLGDINDVNKMIDKNYAYGIFHGGSDVLSDKMLPIVKDLRKLVEQTNTPSFIMDSTFDLDQVYVILQCIEKAQSLDTNKVVDTIEHNMPSIDTIYGKGKWGGQDIFGINHVVIRPVTLSKIVNGKVEFEFIEQ